MVSIEPLLEQHYPTVRAIFEEGIAGGDATFEAVAPDWRGFDDRFLPACRLVARDGGDVVGWAALTPYSRREVYRGVAEVSVYVASSSRGRGVGRALLEALIAFSEAEGFWTLQAGIFTENAASLALHHACGFRIVGERQRIGRMPDGRWRDVVLMERRSAAVD